MKSCFFRVIFSIFRNTKYNFIILIFLFNSSNFIGCTTDHQICVKARNCVLEFVFLYYIKLLLYVCVAVVQIHCLGSAT